MELKHTALVEPTETKDGGDDKATKKNVADFTNTILCVVSNPHYFSMYT